MFAKIVNDTVVQLSVNPSEQFHPGVASLFEEVPDSVQVGYTKVNGNWQEPQLIEQPETLVESPTLSPLQFKMLLHPQERIELTKRRSTDELIEDFFTILDDPRLETVDLGLMSVREGIRYCMMILVGSVIESQEAAEQRISEILSGVAQ